MSNFIPDEDLARFHSSLESGADAFTRSMLLNRLLRGKQKSPVSLASNWTQ